MSVPSNNGLIGAGLSAEGLQAKHDEYVAQGYEGIMLRNKAGKYAVGHRSSDLQKFKKFLDD
jgi:ATP-dependent DNA ligase